MALTESPRAQIDEQRMNWPTSPTIIKSRWRLLSALLPPAVLSALAAKRVDRRVIISIQACVEHAKDSFSLPAASPSRRET
ncbi:hypothetical protein FKP32DRAFT_1587795 [Trametes sanguinea]|nr:hypothetical protein FKP32DRAFT_1587795 [Trametes sanguinea]